MKKRLIKSAIILVVIMLCTISSGCHYLFRPTLQTREGVTLMYYTGTDGYYALVEIVFKESETLDAHLYDDYMYRVFNTATTSPFQRNPVERSADGRYAKVSYYLKSNSPFYYSVKPKQREDFFFGFFETDIKFKSGSVDNPFDAIKESGTKMNDIAYILNGNSYNIEGHQDKWGFSMYNYNYRLLIQVNGRYKSDDGRLFVNAAQYYMEWNYKFETGQYSKDFDPIKISFNYFVSVGWWMISVAIGILVTILILIFANKGDGTAIIKTAKAAPVPIKSSISPFGSEYNNASCDPFNGRYNNTSNTSNKSNTSNTSIDPFL